MFLNEPSGYPLHGNAACGLHASPGIEVFIITLCAIALVTCLYMVPNKLSGVYLRLFCRPQPGVTKAMFRCGGEEIGQRRYVRPPGRLTVLRWPEAQLNPCDGRKGR